MSFLLNMLSDDAKISSKRFIGFSSFIMLIASWIANTFFEFQVKDQIVECFMYITVVGLGVTAAEKFSYIQGDSRDNKYFLNMGKHKGKK